MKITCVRYFGKNLISSEGGVLFQGNDYNVGEEKGDELCLSYYDKTAKTTFDIWVERRTCKPIRIISTDHLTFRDRFWYYTMIVPKDDRFGEFKESSVHQKFNGSVKQLAPHFYEIEQEDEILIVHIKGNFENTEYGEMVVEHITSL